MRYAFSFCSMLEVFIKTHSTIYFRKNISGKTRDNMFVCLQVFFSSSSVRRLNLQEYQSKKLMADNGINVQKFHMAETLDEAQTIANTFS